MDRLVVKHTYIYLEFEYTEKLPPTAELLMEAAKSRDQYLNTFLLLASGYAPRYPSLYFFTQ